MVAVADAAAMAQTENAPDFVLEHIAELLIAVHAALNPPCPCEGMREERGVAHANTAKWQQAGKEWEAERDQLRAKVAELSREIGPLRAGGAE